MRLQFCILCGILGQVAANLEFNVRPRIFRPI